MVVYFKAKAGPSPIYEITLENVEGVLGRRQPWLQKGQNRGEERLYAVCPYCDTPIHLKAVYKRTDASPRPYGRHTGTAIEGFPFDAVDLECCPYRRESAAPDRNARRRKMGPVPDLLIQMAITEFDRIVLILRDDFGFSFSNAFAGKMLGQWFDAKAYLYTAANLRNLPWMIAYFSPSQNLFGQPVGQNAALASAIRKTMPQAGLSKDGKLEQGSAWYELSLQCLHHRLKIKDQAQLESLKLRVQDFTKTNNPPEAPMVYEQQIIFDPERFESLLGTPLERAKRNEKLLDLARSIAAEKGFKTNVVSQDVPFP